MWKELSFMTNAEIFDKLYAHPNTMPWTRTVIPSQIEHFLETYVQDAENYIVAGAKALDIGCGEGYYSIYLTGANYEVTGIDVSKKAIEYAEANVKEADVDNIKFRVLDATKDLWKLNERYDLAIEWGLIHHLEPKQLEQYVYDVKQVLADGGFYLSASFNPESHMYGKPGDKVRKTPIGTTLYYHTLKEMEALFSPNFEVLDRRVEDMHGNNGSHKANVFYMRNKPK